MTPTPAARRPSLVPGILLAVLGGLLLLAAIVVFAVSQVVGRLASTPAVEMPDVVKFDAAAGAYDIYLTDDSAHDIDAIVCAVSAEGFNAEVRGADQNLISTDEGGGDQLIGSFAVAGGPSTVACEVVDGSSGSSFYRVQPSSPAALVAAIALLVGGLLAGGAAALVLLLRVNARRRAG